jgi:peroxiredoxin (alkyl hydroperoxide reductase subunit C)
MSNFKQFMNMKKIIMTAFVLVFISAQIMAQEKEHRNYPMLGEAAPAFTAESTLGTMNFPGDYTFKWKILFSHPADFTPVCTSEILELAASEDAFAKLGTKIIVVSTDDLDKHVAWEKDMEAITYKDRAPSKIDFPLVSDQNLAIAKQYGMIQPGTSSTRDVRGVFIVDPKNKIRAIFFYPMEVGRNLGEIERTLVALQTADKQHVLTPANWQPGGDVLLPYVKSTDEADKLATNDDAGYYQLTWYMRFKKGTK